MSSSFYYPGMDGICPLCPSQPWDEELGVLNFPRKPAKKPPRVERTLTCVVTRHRQEGEDEFLLTRRPNKGLLAGLWEFPSRLLQKDKLEEEHKGALCADLSSLLGVQVIGSSLKYVGDVVHVFSHIHQTYVVHALCLRDAGAPTQAENAQWLSRSALQEAAVPTGVKKVVNLCDLQKKHTSAEAKRRKKGDIKEVKKRPRGVKKATSNTTNNNKQLSLTSFFKTTKQEP